MGREELIDDERFLDNAARMRDVPGLEEELEKTFPTNTTAYWVELLGEGGVPANLPPT